MSPATSHHVDVDPYEAVITLARREPSIKALCDVSHSVTGAYLRTQVDMRHCYGQDDHDLATGDWRQDSQGLTFTPVGGSPQLDVRVEAVAFEARCYGDTPNEAWAVYRALMEMTRYNERRVVPITAGNALVYWVRPLGGPRLVVEDEIRPSGGMPCWAVQLKAEVSGELVS